MAQRSTEFMTKNKIIDPSVQKAFLPGISGCTEHITVMSEVIKHIKHQKKTVHITFCDLADAFGSIPHNTILYALKRNQFPQEFQNYFENYYKQVKARVVTKSFKSEIFQFKKGVTQGDPMSASLFILTFQPILDYLKTEEHHGVVVNGKKIITLPYADGFCVITTNVRTQARIISEINKRINSMGMALKPSKCRSFSLRAGQPSIVNFYIDNNLIPSIAQEEQKFLGKVILYSDKSINTLNYLKEILNTRLSNIDKMMIREEYKLWIYEKYFLPFIRFLTGVLED